MDSFVKPKIQLTGRNGNVFVLTGACRRALKDQGLRLNEREKYHKLAVEMTNKIHNAESYDKALQIMMDYCEVS